MQTRAVSMPGFVSQSDWKPLKGEKSTSECSVNNEQRTFAGLLACINIPCSWGQSKLDLNSGNKI
jgi:hypothetical protein